MDIFKTLFNDEKSVIGLCDLRRKTNHGTTTLNNQICVGFKSRFIPQEPVFFQEPFYNEFNNENAVFLF